MKRTTPTSRSWAAAVVLPLTLGLSGCIHKIVDKATVKGVVAESMRVPDVDMACETGVSLRTPVAAMTKKKSLKAMLISEMTAGMCDEVAALDAELDAALALSAAHELGPVPRAVAAKDARLRAERLHARSAERYYRAWQTAEAAFGPYGPECPKLKEWEELAYFLGLFAGVQAVLHDSAAGGPVGVPKEVLLSASRASECLDNDQWWHVPQAVRGAVWATIPGSGPDDVDPWALIDEAAEKSDKLGIRVPRGLQATIAVNNGKDEIALEAIQKHAATLAATPADADYLLLDRFAFLLSQFQSDLIWIAEEGHRTPVFGELPRSLMPEDDAGGDDPFGSGDPFGGGDPFGADPVGGDDAPAGDEAAAPNDPPSAEEE
jgi:hypothetical protein